MPRKTRYKVFVSYSRHDEALVRPLAGLLGAAASNAVFLDVNSLKPGDSWRSEIRDAVRNASVFIVCWCCESKKSEFIAEEIRTALEDADKHLVPVRLCEAPLPDRLSDRQWIDLRGRIVHECTDPEELLLRGYRGSPLQDGFHGNPNIGATRPKKRYVSRKVTSVKFDVLSAAFLVCLFALVYAALTLRGGVGTVQVKRTLLSALAFSTTVTMIAMFYRLWRNARAEREGKKSDELAAMAREYFSGVADRHRA